MLPNLELGNGGGFSISGERRKSLTHADRLSGWLMHAVSLAAHVSILGLSLCTRMGEPGFRIEWRL